MQDCKPASTPLPAGLVLLLDDPSTEFDITTYAHTVGKLLYATQSRPDIAYAVNLVSRFMFRPRQSHWIAVKHILRYLKGTSDYGILYKRCHSSKFEGYTHTKPAPIPFLGFTDSDWAACKESRRSTGAYLFNIVGGAVSWASK